MSDGLFLLGDGEYLSNNVGIVTLYQANLSLKLELEEVLHLDTA
jgi:hypothetical protein